MADRADALKITPGSQITGHVHPAEALVSPNPPVAPLPVIWIDPDDGNFYYHDPNSGQMVLIPYVRTKGDAMTGNLDVRGTKVGLIWNGTTYYGVQSKTVAADGTGGPALLLGSTAVGSDNVYLIAAGTGAVVFRPGNPTAVGTYDVKVVAAGVDMASGNSRLAWAGENLGIWANDGMFYFSDSATGTVPKPVYIGAPTIGLHAVNRDYADGRYVAHVDGDVAGVLTVSSASNYSEVRVSSTVATTAGLLFQKLNSTRWKINAGSNAADFAIGRYNDSATYLDSPLVISRSSGQIFLNNPVDMDGGGESLAIKPGSSDHAYIGFYPNTSAKTTRWGFLGFGSAGSSNLTLKNEVSGAHVYVQNTGTGGCFNVMAAYTTTTTGSANGYVASNGNLARSTSSMRFKHAIRALRGGSIAGVPVDRSSSAPTVDPETILNTTPAQFVADAQSDGLRERVGLIAEDVRTHAPWAVNEAGDAIEWSSVTTALLDVVKRQQEQISDLVGRITALEGAAA